ncbi:MAG: DUF3667 domain-containing protein [Planctomycetota bacterium]
MVASAPPTPCPNCGAAPAGRYCHDCGQDNRLLRLDGRLIAKETLQNALGWDSALANTVRGLLRGPGRLVEEYAGGRRRRFVHPARFCLLSLTLWFVVTRVLFLDPMESSGIQISTTGAEGDAADFAAGVRAFLTRHLDLMLFLALPLRAVLLRAFFRSSGRNVAEAMVLVLYVSGLGFLLGAVLAPVQALGWEAAGSLRPLLTVVWTYWAALQFFGHGRLATLWRTVCVVVLHAAVTVLLFLAVAVPWVLVTG